MNKQEESWIQHASADQLLDELSAIAGDDEEVSEIVVALRRILIDEEVIES